MTLRARLGAQVNRAAQRLVASGQWPAAAPPLRLEVPASPAHGDYAISACLAAARQARVPPRQLAGALAEAIRAEAGGALADCAIAGPGYLNLTLAPGTLAAEVARAAVDGAAFLRGQPARPQRILVEHVSANPTGPLHVAHGRGAVTGDVIANLLAAAGHRVEREYYVNDQGGQVTVLARSVWVRYLEAAGRSPPHPEDFYPGDYVVALAQALFARVGAAWADDPPEAHLPALAQLAVEAMLGRIRADLHDFGVTFDRFVSERALATPAALAALWPRLEAGGHLFDKDGKRWLNSRAFGDDKDRVVVREDGRPTYLAGDILYHDDKAGRGYDRLINVWGADHAGYLARVRASLAALGHRVPLEVVFVQMVSVSRGGQALRMGKRLGTAVWLKEVVDEVGKDAARYLFVTRRAEAQMDFDCDLAVRKSLDNPVFYAQMGHARLAAILRRARARDLVPPAPDAGRVARLALPEERALMVAMCRAPEVVEDAADSLEPHRVATYLQGLIGQFHAYYTQNRHRAPVVGPDRETSEARLMLCVALKGVMAGLLALLGVGAPESMQLPEGAGEDGVEA